VQPLGELVEGGRITAGQHLDIAVGQIDRVSRNAERCGHPSRTVAEKNALDPAFDRESTGCVHRVVLRAVFLAGFAQAQCAVRFGFRGQCIAPGLCVVLGVNRFLGAVQQFHGGFQIGRGMVCSPGVAGRADGLARVRHLLHRRSRLASGNAKHGHEQCGAQEDY